MSRTDPCLLFRRFLARSFGSSSVFRSKQFGRSARRFITCLGGLAIVCATAPAFGQTINIANVTDFDNAMTTINANPGNTYTLNLTAGFSLNQVTNFANNQVTTIQGNGFSINGGSAYQPFVINSGVVQVSNLTATNLLGPIQINNGVLIGSTSDVLQGNIHDDGQLVFSQLVAGTYGGIISGTGSVQIDGAAVTFTGANNYSGGTTIDVLSKLIGTTTSLQGDITTNGLLQFSQATAGTYAGNIDGTGNVQFSGGSQFTLTGTSTNAGLTTVDASTTVTGTTANIQGGILNNGSVEFNQATSGTYSGNMAGAGSVEISGVGPITFSGNNSYTGGTTVDVGSKLIGTSDSLQGAVTNNGAVQFNQATAGTYAENMTGTGSLQISGVGPITLTGSNSYSGGTTIDASSKLVGNTDSVQGDISNQGALQFDQTTAGTYGGAISGAGTVQISGPGPVTFTGLNNYSGGSIVDVGSTLVGTTDSLQGTFNNKGDVQFNQATTGTYSGDMFGLGRVQISGGGAVTFTGTNAYTGGTTIDLGSTLIGTTDSLQGAFTNNGAVQFDQLTAGTYSGNMTGTGSVEISGSGPVTFSGSNSYNGGTTVDVGATLIGTTSSVQGAITSNGAVQFNQSGTGTYSGVLSGTGSVQISGGGSVTFSGLNNYTGGTTIDSGSTLVGTTDSLQGNFTDNGTMMFLQNTNGTFGGNISGSGGVEIVTLGTTQFTGTNSYTGGTTVDGGAILQGTTDSLQGNFLNNGKVVFDQAVAGIYAGNMSGAGSVEINSTAPITFTGTNSYQGGTTIDSGNSLIGTTSSLTGNMIDNGLLTFNQSGSGTFAGNISGTGGVAITGMGHVTLSGANTYAGGTSVDPGAYLSGTTSSLQGNINNLGQLEFNQATTGTYAGDITGTGSVGITGGGVVNFSGTNSYTGGTVIDINTTLVGTTSSLQGSFLNNGGLQFSQTTAGTFGGSITGGGAVHISGAGPITFTGPNNYTGGTVIDSGSKLTGDTNSLYGGFSNNGSLQFNQNTAGTFIGAISGVGGVEFSGAGIYTMTGSNSYTGGTLIDAGATVIGNTDSLQKSFNNNGTLIFNQPGNSTFIGSIAGAGSVEFGGTGILTLIGTNSYTGGTTVDAGVGLIGNTNNIQGNIINNGEVQFNQTAAGTYSGNMSGTGLVEISGNNRVTFTGTNDYSGGTIVNSGSTLIGSTSSVQGDIANGGTVQFNIASLGMGQLGNNYGGNMSGTGKVIVNGPGSMVFSGFNSYVGGTTINSGSGLQGSTFAVQGNITNNGTVTFNNDTGNLPALTSQGYPYYSGNMTGTGSVHISGTTPVVFSGVNNYTGGTNINTNATLIGTTSSLQGSIFSDGLVVFSQQNAGTYSGAMSGSGSALVSGPGAVTFSGTNTYTGGTTVDVGSTLIGSTKSLQGSIVNNGTLNFNQTASGVFSDVISGSGSVGVSGYAPVFFSNNNTYTGGTSIGNNGILVVAGSVVGTTSVNNGGTLMGNGIVAETVVNAGGTLFPHTITPIPLSQLNANGTGSAGGHSLTVNGNLTMMTGSYYTTELSPTASDSVVVTGQTQIGNGSTLNLSLNSGTYTVGTKYQIMSAAGGLVGGFTSMNTSSYSQNIRFLPEYSANDLKLIVESNLSPAAQTPNQAAVATAIDQVSASATGDYANAITQLTTLNSSQLSGALNQLSNEIYSSVGAVERQTTTLQLQLLGGRLASLTGPGMPSVASTGPNGNIRFVSQQGTNPQSSDIPPGRPTSSSQMSWTTWAQGYGLGGNLGGDGNAGGLNYRLGGTLFGVEKWLDESTMIGVLGGYAGTSVGDRLNGSSAQINSYQVGLYEMRRMDSMYLSNIDAFGNSDYETTRDMNFGTINQTAKGNSSGMQWAHYTEVGTTLEFDDFKLQPLMGMQYMYLNQKGYTESGAGVLDMTSDTQSISSYRQSFGARAYFETMVGDVLVIPSMSARYQHEFGNGTQLVTSSFSGAPTVQFATAGTQTGRDFGMFSLGATAYFTERLSVYGTVDTQVASQYTALIGSGGLQYSW